jgi:23S rRNA (pseudouridine1915-N3)-methyltransferase
MQLTLICVGHNQPSWVVDGTQEYQKRFGRTWPFTLIEIRPEKRLTGRSIDALLTLEAVRIRAQVPRDAALIALDERGEGLSSRRLADKLLETERAARGACFVIGSADGLDPALRASALWQWSLSKLTFPHGLARVCAVEQLYRAVSLLEGSPYHRD